jgi:hypothetical protein
MRAKGLTTAPGAGGVEGCEGGPCDTTLRGGSTVAFLGGKVASEGAADAGASHGMGAPAGEPGDAAGGAGDCGDGGKGTPAAGKGEEALPTGSCGAGAVAKTNGDDGLEGVPFRAAFGVPAPSNHEGGASEEGGGGGVDPDANAWAKGDRGAGDAGAPSVWPIVGDAGGKGVEDAMKGDGTAPAGAGGKVAGATGGGGLLAGGTGAGAKEKGPADCDGCSSG